MDLTEYAKDLGLRVQFLPNLILGIQTDFVHAGINELRAIISQFATQMHNYARRSCSERKGACELKLKQSVSQRHNY